MNKATKQRIATHKARKAKGKLQHERTNYFGYFATEQRRRKRRYETNRFARSF